MRHSPSPGLSRAISSIGACCGRRGAGPLATMARIGPAPPDKVGVPAQQGLRGDHQPRLAELAAGQQPGRRGCTGTLAAPPGQHHREEPEDRAPVTLGLPKVKVMACEEIVKLR